MCPIFFTPDISVYVMPRKLVRAGTPRFAIGITHARLRGGLVIPAMIPSFGVHMPMIRLLCLLLVSSLAVAQQFDIVLEGGRVMDPETGLDGVRNVGIRDGKIARIATEPLSGARLIQVSGLVIAPGFIDLHQHGQELASQRVKAFDGVTTALEMEIGVPDVAAFLKWKQGRSIIHYGTTA